MSDFRSPNQPDSTNPAITSLFQAGYHRRGSLIRHVVLQPPQLTLHHYPRLRRDQIPKTIRRIIAANTILIGIYFQHIFRPIRIMLQ